MKHEIYELRRFLVFSNYVMACPACLRSRYRDVNLLLHWSYLCSGSCCTTHRSWWWNEDTLFCFREKQRASEFFQNNKDFVSAGNKSAKMSFRKFPQTTHSFGKFKDLSCNLKILKVFSFRMCMTLCIQASMCRGVSLSTKVHVSVSVWVHVPVSICLLDHLYVWSPVNVILTPQHRGIRTPRHSPSCRHCGAENMATP